jgi:hypothetical protein
MQSPRHRGRSWPLIGALILTLTATTGVAATAGGGAAVPHGGDTMDAPAAVGREPLTLVTGDRVVLDQFGDGRQAVSVEPADRHGGTPGFHTIEDGGHVNVIPFDAAPLVP